MRVVPPEVAELCGPDPRATFFLCHRLRRNWGSGNVRQTDLLEVALRPREEVVTTYPETYDTTVEVARVSLVLLLSWTRVS